MDISSCYIFIYLCIPILLITFFDFFVVIVFVTDSKIYSYIKERHILTLPLMNPLIFTYNRIVRFILIRK